MYINIEKVSQAQKRSYVPPSGRILIGQSPAFGVTHFSFFSFPTTLEPAAFGVSSLTPGVHSSPSRASRACKPESWASCPAYTS